MLFQEFLSGLLGLHGGQLVPLGFKSADNVSNNSALKKSARLAMSVMIRRQSSNTFLKLRTYLYTIGLDLGNTLHTKLECERTIDVSLIDAQDKGSPPTYHDVSSFSSVHRDHGRSPCDGHLVGKEGRPGSESKSRSEESDEANSDKGLHVGYWLIK
jgi:hypothetical protein